MNYAFYINTYHGGSIPEEEFPWLAARAEEQLARFKRIYTVTALEPDSEAKAVCAMADALYFFQSVQSGGLVTGSSIGSVSTSYQVPAVDGSPKAQGRELYRCAGLYLDIQRGVR